MVKFSSILFTSFVVSMFLLGILISLIPTLISLAFLIKILIICSLISGIVLIISLIFDRFKDAKSEGDDYKKY